MPHPYPSLYAIPEDAKTLDEPSDDAPWAPCTECGVIGTVPIFDPDGDPEDENRQRLSDHSRGSEICPTCEGKGWVTAQPQEE